jgi:hypothetical protein
VGVFDGGAAAAETTSGSAPGCVPIDCCGDGVALLVAVAGARKDSWSSAAGFSVLLLRRDAAATPEKKRRTADRTSEYVRIVTDAVHIDEPSSASPGGALGDAGISDVEGIDAPLGRDCAYSALLIAPGRKAMHSFRYLKSARR